MSQSDPTVVIISHLFFITHDNAFIKTYRLHVSSYIVSKSKASFFLAAVSVKTCTDKRNKGYCARRSLLLRLCTIYTYMRHNTISNMHACDLVEAEFIGVCIFLGIKEFLEKSIGLHVKAAKSGKENQGKKQYYMVESAITTCHQAQNGNAYICKPWRNN